MILTILLLAVSLSIDSLGIGISYGIRSINIPFFTKVIISFQSIIITGISIILGKWLAAVFVPQISKNIGVIILIFMGIWIIYQGFSKKEKKKHTNKEKTILNLIIKSLGITIQIIKTPQSCDIDNSKKIEPGEALYLGLALSIDSFGAGIGTGMSGIFTPIIPFAVSLFQFIFLSTGSFLGDKIGKNSNVNEKVWVILSGGILIFIGILRAL